MVVGSLTTFLASGGVILGLTIAEKCGVTINDKVVRYSCLGVVLYGFVVLLQMFVRFL